MASDGLKSVLSKDSPLSNPTRLAIMLLLIREGARSMSKLKDALSLTFGNLDSHVNRLKKAKFAKSEKRFTRKGLRTMIVATRKGTLDAIDQANALRALLDISAEPPAQILEVYVLREGGRLLAHESLHSVSDVDADLVGATLTALQDFVKVSWDGEDIKAIQFGTRRLLMRRNKYISIALVLGSGSTEIWENRIGDLVDLLEGRYGKVVKEWSGDKTEISGLLDELRSFLELHDQTVKA